MFDIYIKFIQDALAFCYNLGSSLGFPSYGVSIIIFTIIIKLLLLPLTIKQIKSTKAMQLVQPKMKELQEKYKHDKERLQQEMVKLYQETGFNPLAGCLPLIIQMPILMGVFFALKDFNYGDVIPTFLWLPSLADPDPLYILPVFSALTTFIQTYQTMPDTSATQNRMMLYFMPLFIGYISLRFPSGLVLYWATTNVLQVLQQTWFSYKDKKAKSV